MIRHVCEPLSVNVQNSNDVAPNILCEAGVRTRIRIAHPSALEGFVAFDRNAPPFKHLVAADADCE